MIICGWLVLNNGKSGNHTERKKKKQLKKANQQDKLMENYSFTCH